jgi:Domain of unknown function (DUF397)
MEAVDSATWRKSSKSGGNGGSCIEAGIASPGRVLVRDTTDRDGEVLSFTAESWRVFTDALK